MDSTLDSRFPCHSMQHMFAEQPGGRSCLSEVSLSPMLALCSVGTVQLLSIM